MLRNLNVGRVIYESTAPSTIQGALAYGITHPCILKEVVEWHLLKVFMQPSGI